MTALSIVIAVLLLVCVGLLLWLAARVAAQGRAVKDSLEQSVRGQERIENLVRGEFSQSRMESADLSLKLSGQVSLAIEQMGASLREEVTARLREIREDNERRLEDMRRTVDEKLHETLERRLGESFRQVSERLEQVHQGLGEMQALAAGVGDLKRVLTNVKTRGMWGEVQLSRLLEQVLAPDQYEANVATKGSGERVEFAIKLPGRDGDGKCVWLPIDAKFPLEDYQRLLDAYDQADAVAADATARALEQRVKAAARDIRDKYLNPPVTTDFAIMFLPTEGLYAEVLRRPGLVDTLQQDFRVVVSGPTTLLALLNSLQMGFRTLAIEKRSSEVWELLGAVRTQFGVFGEVLAKVQKRLHQASETIEDAARKSRRIESKLRRVQEVPKDRAALLLGEEPELPAPNEEEPTTENADEL